jgi:hypothetical protein
MLPWFKTSYQNILISKTLDGTAEYMQGKPYYILSNEDWRLLRAWRIPLLKRRPDHAAMFNDFEVEALMHCPAALEWAADYNDQQAAEADAVGVPHCAAVHTARATHLMGLKAKLEKENIFETAAEARGADAAPFKRVEHNKGPGTWTGPDAVCPDQPIEKWDSR